MFSCPEALGLLSALALTMPGSVDIRSGRARMFIIDGSCGTKNENDLRCAASVRMVSSASRISSAV